MFIFIKFVKKNKKQTNKQKKNSKIVDEKNN